MSATLLTLILCGAPLAPDREVAYVDEERQAPRAEGQQSPAEAAASALEVAVHESLAQGLEWLAQRQSENLDGSMPVTISPNGLRAPIATTALGVLALMAGGNGYGRGPHGENVARAVDYLLAHTELDEASEFHGFVGRLSAPSAVKMHSHGFATLALAQAYSTSPRTQVGETLRRALVASVGLIERTQGGEGGWFYEPQRMAQHEGSVTICLVAALRAARDAGVRVDSSVIRRAQEYVKKSQRDNGLFAYELGDPSAHTSVALTAAAVATLYSMGEYAGAVVDRGVEAIWRELQERELGGAERARFPYYERLYLAQAFWQNGDPAHYERWAAKEFRALIADQAADGHWTDKRHGDGYATAVNCIVLGMGEGMLPVFQR